MKVAITFIGTNKYLDFLPRYYENIKEYSQFEGLNDEWEDFNERDFENSGS